MTFMPRRAHARQLKAAWESFPELPGEHLRWHKTAPGVSQVATRDGRVLATVEGVGLFGTWIPQRLPHHVQVDQETYLINGGTKTVLVTAPDGSVVLSFTGLNFNHQARAVAHMPNGQALRFPVEGTTRGNAVMTATDSDQPVFRIRRVRGAGPGQKRKNMVEIVVEPGRQITNELLLAVVVGYRNLYWFFAVLYAG